MNRLPELIAKGAIITMADGYRVILADAVFTGSMLWWFEAGGREHMIDVDQVEDDGTWLKFTGDDAATIGELEGPEDEADFKAWQEYLASAAGAGVADSIEQMKQAALNWKGD